MQSRILQYRLCGERPVIRNLGYDRASWLTANIRFRVSSYGTRRFSRHPGAVMRNYSS